MSALHFMCGKPGAGKTRLARRLARELPAVFVSEDEWLSRTAEPIESLHDYLAASSRWRAAMAPHVSDLLRLGVSVVFDFGGYTVSERAWARSVFERAAADHVLHVLTVDDAICSARIRARNEAQTDGEFFGIVTDAQVAEVLPYFAPPLADEGFNIIWHSADDDGDTK
jgi:predicted kinase